MDLNSDERNIVLIGMPGVGKSTVGVLLAKRLSRSFIDTDVVIQASEQRRLQAIIDAEGAEAFRAIEQRHVCALALQRHVIATGGSVVYGAEAMEHLKRDGVTVFMDLPFDLLERRIADLDSRGVLMGCGQTLCALYKERGPLYERWADITLDCAGLTHDRTVTAMVRALEQY